MTLSLQSTTGWTWNSLKAHGFKIANFGGLALIGVTLAFTGLPGEDGGQIPPVRTTVHRPPASSRHSFIASLPPRLYIAGPIDAEAVTEGSDETARWRNEVGDVYLRSEFGVLMRIEACDEGQLMQMVAHENDIRQAMGLPEITIVDLRR